METFTQAVESWHDFYHLIGDAAAALMGLLFVSLSLNVDVVILKKNADLRVLAAQTFTNFLCVIMFAALILIPNQGTRGLGLPLLGIDAIGLYVTIQHSLETHRNRPRRWGKGSLARRFVIPMLCFVTVFIVAILVLMGKTSGLYWLVPVTISLIWDASINAWDLLLRLRKPPMEL